MRVYAVAVQAPRHVDCSVRPSIIRRTIVPTHCRQLQCRVEARPARQKRHSMKIFAGKPAQGAGRPTSVKPRFA